MMHFGLNRGQRDRRAEDDDPIKAQASWQLEHGTDQHDRTPDQDRRYHEYNVLLNHGVDVAHAGFYRWLARSGRVTP